jgi:hypothetical protein
MELAEDNVTIYFNASTIPSLIFKDSKYLGLIKTINRKY